MRINYRIGVMPGPPGPAGRDFFWRFVELCEKTEIDSVWARLDPVLRHA